MSEQNTEFDINQPFVTQEQKFKYWEESKAHIKEANKRIDALQGEVAGLRFECAIKDLHTDTLLEQLEEARISNTELQATNHDLREASQALIDRWDTPKWKDAEHTAIFINVLRNALSTTPAESLQAHDAETIKRYADDLDNNHWVFIPHDLRKPLKEGK